MSAPVVEYTIVWGGPVELAEKVNELIAKGWQPQGDIVCQDGESSNIFQVLVKRGKQ